MLEDNFLNSAHCERLCDLLHKEQEVYGVAVHMTIYSTWIGIPAFMTCDLEDCSTGFSAVIFSAVILSKLGFQKLY